jgi:hypothetical protein
LQASWFFECTCPRCLDPTEFNTYLRHQECFKLFDSYIQKLPIGTGTDLQGEFKFKRDYVNKTKTVHFREE